MDGILALDLWGIVIDLSRSINNIVSTNHIGTKQQ